jgi:hypothetical protein
MTTTESVLDIDYIYNITKALSHIIFTEYNESNGEIARGRTFGTKGEHKAAEILLENMTDLGLWAWKEQIKNLPPELPKVAGKYEIIDYQLKITNKKNNESRVVDCYIKPVQKGERGNPGEINHNFSFQDLEIIPLPKGLLSIPLKDLIFREKKDFVFLMEEDAFNPNNPTPLIKKIMLKFLSPYSDFTLFFNSIKTINAFKMWYKLLPHCQGLIEYDFNNDTYNMGNSFSQSLPSISINGTIGREILREPHNYTASYYLNQKYIEEVESYNVIGQLNGTDPSKTLIIDCLYDGWWCQATADSAIGMAMVLGIAKYFMDQKITPKYTIKFIGFGGEEHGFRGAKYYEAAHRDENIIYVIDLNQLGFSQEWPKLSLDILANNKRFLDDIWEVAKRTNYEDRPGDTNELRKFWMPRGAPSDDQPFARKRTGCKTVCFLKGFCWILHHRDGLNHTEGDVLKYFDPDDVSATGEMILNITKYLTVDSDGKSIENENRALEFYANCATKSSFIKKETS